MAGQQQIKIVTDPIAERLDEMADPQQSRKSYQLTNNPWPGPGSGGGRGGRYMRAIKFRAWDTKGGR